MFDNARTYRLAAYSYCILIYILFNLASELNAAISRSLFSILSDNERVLPNQDNLANDVVFVMLSFALDLLLKMKEFNEENMHSDDTKRTRGALRIGNLLIY